MSAEVQSLFGVRKVRAPPPGSDTLTPDAVSASPSVSTGSGAVVDSPFGVRKTRFPPEGVAVATPDSSTTTNNNNNNNNSSPFGPRIGGASRGGAASASAGGGGLPPLAETNSGSASPFGATLRRTPSSVLGGSGAAGGSRAGPSAAAAAKPMTTQQQQVTPPPPPPQQPTTVSTTDGRKVLLSHYERIEAFIYCLQAQRIRNQKRCLSAIHTIQQEYRAFLEREGPTTEIRNRKRTLRRQLLARLQAKFKDTALVAREEGLKIAMEEAAAWAAINRAAVYLRVRELALHEERRRQHVLSTELEAFKRTFLSPSNLDIPPCFIPGSLEREEWQMRIHILNFERFERLRCRARWIAEAGAILLVDEQNYRRSVMHMESADCMQLLHFMREDFVCARCLELSALEARFRLLIEEQRHQFMRSLRRQCAGYLALTLMDPSNPYGEEAHRRAIEDKEHFYRSMFTQEFLERRYFLTVATCQRDEYSLRCGQRGIEAQERLERRAIHSAMLKGMLMRIQGIRCGDDDERMVLASSSSSSSEMMMRAMSVTFGDPMTEAGGRSTIELQEARERRAIEFTLNKEAVQVFLPALEAHQRRTLVQRERRELQILIRELDILPLLFCTQEEPIARSRIVDASRQSLKQLMFHFAFLRLIGNELRERAHLIQQVAVFEERLLVLHYLSRMEITERRVLRKGIKSLNRRVREQLVLVPQQQQEQQQRSMMTHPRGVEALLNHSRFDEPLVLVVSDGSPISKTASALLNRLQQQQQHHQQRETPLDLMTFDGSPFERRFSPSSPKTIFDGSSKRSVEALLSSSAMTHTLSVVDDDSASSPQQSAFPLAAKIAAVVDQPLRRRRQQSASLDEQKRSSHTLDLLDSDEALDGSQWSDHLSRPSPPPPPPPPPRRDVTDVDYKRTGTTRGSTTPSRNATELAPPAVAAAAATSPISKQIDHRGGGGGGGDPSSPLLNPYLAPLLVSTPSLHQYVAPKATSPLTTTPSSQTAASTKHASPSSPSSSRGAAARSSRVQVIHEYTAGVASSDHSPVMVIYRAEQIPGKSASK